MKQLSIKPGVRAARPVASQRRCVAPKAQCRSSSSVQPLGCADVARSQPASLDRRQALMAAAALALAVGNSTFVSTPAALAERPLPKAYQELVLTMCKSLREAIEAEQAGESEADVRRKADPAKDALMQFVRRWRGDPVAKNHPSHPQVLAILSELGTFYQKNGPRTRLPDDLKARVLGYVDEAEKALAKEGKKAPEQQLPAPPSILRGNGEDGLRELLPGSA